MSELIVSWDPADGPSAGVAMVWRRDGDRLTLLSVERGVGCIRRASKAARIANIAPVSVVCGIVRVEAACQ